MTLPLSGLFAVWGLAVADRYQTFGLRYGDADGRPGMLTTVMDLEWKQLWRHARYALHSSGSRQKGYVPRVYVTLSPSKEAKLNSGLPKSGRKFVNARLGYPDGEFHGTEMRYRGDFYWHWAQEKKSWRIKTDKGQLWNGMRSFNLIVPKSLAIADGHLAHWLSRELGLLTPKSDVAELWVNNENRGLHTLVEQLDEGFLRRNGRMPTDLYVGELVGRDGYLGYRAKLFDDPGTWTKAAFNNHYPEKSLRPLQILCSRLDAAQKNGSVLAREAAAEQLRSLFDIESLARFSAFRILCQSGHQDDLHNWRLYYDPWRRGFEPVMWDPNAWHQLWAPKEGRPFFQIPLFSELDRVLSADQVYRFAVHRALADFFAEDGDQKLLDEWHSQRERMWPAAQRDPALGAHFKYLDMGHVEAACASLERVIPDYLALARTVHFEGPVEARVQRVASVDSKGGKGENAEQWIRLEVGGWKPAAALILQFEEPVPEGLTWTLTEEGTTNPRAMDLGPWVFAAEERAEANAERIGAKTVRIERPFLPGLQLKPAKKGEWLFPATAEPQLATYKLGWMGPNGSTISPNLAAVSIRPLHGPDQPLGWSTDVEPQSLARERGTFDPSGGHKPVVWQGSKEIRGAVVIQGDVEWKPGTKVRMGAGATLLIHGKLTAKGTKSDPIEVLPLEHGQAPWGAVALRSHAASGSRLDHVQMNGGSGWQDELLEFSGMLSIHDAQDVEISNCRFTDAYLVDDMVHAVYVDDLLIRDSYFARAFGDAVDLDACSGVLDGCTFDESGNDAIDLMMSRMVIQDCRLEGSGDKGVSVGESSQVLIQGCELYDNQSGVQCKDASSVWIRDCKIRSIDWDVSAYKKNWRYGAGGIGLVQNCRFSGGKGASADRHSELWVLASKGVGGWKKDKHVQVKGEASSASWLEWPGLFAYQDLPLFREWIDKGSDRDRSD